VSHENNVEHHGVFGALPSAPSEDAEIQVSDLSLGYPAHGGGGAFAAVEGVSFSVQATTVTALLGESGSGKSTLARFIAARASDSADRGSRVKLLSGDVRIRAQSLAQLNKKKLLVLSDQIGYVEQDAGAKLHPHLTIGDNLLEPVARRYRRFDRDGYAEKIAQLLDAMNLSPTKLGEFPYQLSKGQRQRVAFARAFVHDPSILVLDEPTMGIDAQTRPKVIDFLSDYATTHHATLVLISHDIDLLERLVDDVNILQDGAVVGRGQINEIFADPEHEYVRKLATALRSRAYDEAFDD
jgi:peptide/nickel transport system ATP-binding protein